MTIVAGGASRLMMGLRDTIVAPELCGISGVVATADDAVVDDEDDALMSSFL